MHKQIKQQQGFAGIVEIGVIAVVLVVLAVGGYLAYQQFMGKSSADSDVKLTNQEKAQLKAACKVEIKDELLCSFISTWGDTASEPATVTTSMASSEGTTKSVTKSDGKNSHSIAQMPDGTAYESIILGEMLYSKINNVWYKQTMTPSKESESIPDYAEPEQMTEEIVSKEKANDIEYKRLGTEKCGTVSCVKYQINDKSTPHELSYLWIDPQKMRLMRMQSKSGEGQDSFDMVYEYGPVTITAPANAKDYSELTAF